MRGLGQALELARQPPLVAEEKEVLFGEVERAVWDFPDGFFVDPPADDAGWEERAGDDPRVRDAMDRGVTRILENRRDEAKAFGRADS